VRECPLSEGETVAKMGHPGSVKEQTDGALCGGGIDDGSVLRDVDFARSRKTAASGAGRLPEGLPIAASGFVLVSGIAADQLRCFGGADGFGLVSVGSAFGKQIEDGGFERGVLFA